MKNTGDFRVMVHCHTVVITPGTHAKLPFLYQIAIIPYPAETSDHKGKISPSKYDSNKDRIENIPPIRGLIRR